MKTPASPTPFSSPKPVDDDSRQASNTARVSLGLCALLILCLGFWQGCGSEDPPSTEDGPPHSPWDDYSIEPPAEDLLASLVDSPYLYPEQICRPITTDMTLPSTAIIQEDESGQPVVCVWQSVVGTVPEGHQYTDFSECDMPLTQAPSWFVEPTQRYTSDPSVLDDAAYAEELSWVQQQIEASGCSCCHASGVGSGHTSGFDVNAPQVWTDSIENYQLAMISGRFEEHRLFGALEADTNHGFSRASTMFPSTDPQRMKAFFEAEFERRNGTEEELEEALAAFQTFFGRLQEAYGECVSPWQGIVDGRVTWDGDGDVRQFYVLKDGTETPGFPPNRDIPEGTVWAFYVGPDHAPVSSGTIELGTVPDGAYQVFPEDGATPELIPGETYRLFATPDFQLIREINCTITHSDSPRD